MPLGSAGGASTPGRSTRVTFRRLFPAIVQRPVLYERRDREIARGSRELPNEVMFIEGVGLRLRPYEFDRGNLFERAPTPAVYRGAFAVVAPGVEEQLVSRQYDYPDLNYSSPESASMPMHQRRIVAGASWEQRLEADQEAFPSPGTSDDPIDLDRVFVSTLNHKPDQALVYSFILPERPVSRGAFATCYFSGIPGINGGGVGNGQYAVKLFFDGKAVLYERCIAGEGLVWRRRFVWQWCEEPYPLQSVYFQVVSDASESCSDGRWSGTVLNLCSTHSFDSKAGGYGLLTAFNSATQALLNKGITKYRIPYDPDYAPTLAPVRLDLRRDVRALFQVSRVTFPEVATWRDDPFEIPVYPGSQTPFVLEWYGDFPEGTEAECKLFFAGTDIEVPHDGMSLEEHWPVQDCLGGVKIYPCTPAMLFTRAYEVEITLWGGYNEAWEAFDKTPTLRRYRVRKNGVTEALSVTPLVFPTGRILEVEEEPVVSVGRQEVVDDVSAEDGQDDPASEACEVSIADFTNEMPELQDIIATPCDVSIHDAEGNLVTRLARFHVARNESSQIRGERPGSGAAIENQYPKPGSRLYRFSGPGEWTRLQRALFPERWYLTEVYASGTETQYRSMKVSNGLRYAIEAAGYPAEMIDVPDLPVRFWSDGGADDESLLVEAYSSVGEFVAQNARDFLGAWPVFDLNAGDDGMWRIRQQQRPPYNNLMRFTRLHPGAKALPHLLASYPIDEGDGEFAAEGQLVPHNYITDEQRHIEPPEGNYVIVHGGASRASTNQGATLLSQFVFNPTSFNVMGLPPEHEFYPDPFSPEFMGGECVPIVVMDGTLTTRAAVDWVARRVFDYACFARRYLTFIAPLRYIVDDLDPLQTNPRKLRFGDPVQVMADDLETWEQWLVVRCSPLYSNDRHQMARYELVTSTIIDRFGMPIGAFDLFTLERMRRASARRSVGVLPRTSFLRTTNRSFSVERGSVVALPVVPASPIQVVDPEDERFGEFLFMPDYDPVP